jgi:hypothetical protein
LKNKKLKWKKSMNCDQKKTFYFYLTISSWSQQRQRRIEWNLTKISLNRICFNCLMGQGFNCFYQLVLHNFVQVANESLE